ncbi:unnamed protein product [Trifolium pratense]|uniref:Uncharacterized protein n=1 Tax=Trifolium pratense TaxID=57577 RepID=A0ACB0KHZ7_TRIPR|nr:unnamed protein product [Trifolium pratense]
MGQRISSAKSSASKLWCFINPRFASSESFTPFYGNYEKLKSQEDSFNLQIHPYELQFPFELKKEISCSLQLSNKSDNYLAFKVNTPNPNKYYVTPNIGAVLPRSTCDIIVTMRAQKEAPLDMQCKDEFVIQSIDANHKRYHSKNGATTKDITPEMFNKESCYEVKECKLRVVYIAPPQLPSQVREGSDKDLKASNNKVEQQDTSLQIHPQELQFPFELRKQISCSLQLSNKSDNDVAFKVKTTNPKKYCVRPNNGVVLPRSTFDIIVIMQAQKQAPPDMQCKDKFLIQSIVANHKSYHSKNGATTKDITPEMFKKESGYEVEECKFKVVYVPPPQPPSLVREGSDEDLSSRASGFPDKARALISKLTEERNSAIDKYKRLEQELELLRREANNNCHT